MSIDKTTYIHNLSLVIFHKFVNPVPNFPLLTTPAVYNPGLYIAYKAAFDDTTRRKAAGIT